MPNDLTTKRNLLDAREDLRLESRRKLASSGFTASTWTLSGVVLVACGGAGEITDALCPNFDAAVLVSCGGGSPPSGERHYVQSSPVQGARLYFDMNNDKVINDMDIATQNGQYPEGFVTDANGEIAPIPLHLYGKSFVAYLDGAINADTGESFPAGTKYYSITHPSDEDDMPASDEGDQDSLLLPFHNLASPITDWIAFQAGFKPSQQQPQPPVRTSSQVFDAVNDVIANLLWSERYSLLNEEQQAIVDLLYAEILNPANYEGNPAIEALSAYLATNPTLENVQSEAQSLIEEVRALVNSDSANALIVLHVDDETSSANDVTIGTNGAYVATVYAVGTGGVSYRMVDENDVEVSGGDFVVDSRTGVISVADGADLTASNTAIPVYVQVTSGGETETVKIDVTVQSVITLSSGSTNDVAENDAGAVVVMGIEAGDTATAEDFIISVLGGLSGYADKFEMEAVSGATNMWNLKLKSGESLDYEAIRGGEIKINVQVEPDNHAPSNVLEFTITVTDDPMDITFSGDFGGEVIEDATDEDNLEGSVSGTITVRNNRDSAPVTVDQSEPDADGKYGTLTLNEAGDGWTYTLGVDANDDPLADDVLTEIQSLRAGEFLVDTATISVGTASKDIYVIIHGKNEDVGFGPEMRAAMDIEIGDTALGGVNGFELGNVLTDFGMTLEGRLDDAATTVAFADSVSADLRTLFTLTESGDGVGTLTFTGTSAQAADLGIGTIEFAMIASVPHSTTEEIEEIDPFTVQVNVAVADQTISIDENANSPANQPTLPDGSTYRITDGTGMSVFEIDENTGMIALASGTTLDFENDDPMYTLEITSTDGSDTSTATITVTVRDLNEAPAFDQATYSATIAEDLAVSMPVGVTVSAMDVDDSTTPNGQLTYSITAGNTGNAFDIDGATGVITVNSALDFETTPSYTLTVTATDGGTPALTSTNTATVTITLSDVNEAPVFATTTYSATIAEDLAVSMPVGVTVSAMDVDDSTTPNGQLTYSITAGNTGNAFDIDGATGVITVNSALDFETTPSYTLTVTATDGGTPALTSTNTATVTITLTDVDETPPEEIPMNSPPYTQTRQEAEAYDPDDLGLTPMPDPAEPM